jgi:hypothetical protein
MDGATIISLTLSVIAVVVSTMIACLQLVKSSQTNHLTILSQFVQISMSADFLESEAWIYSMLPGDSSAPSVALSKLAAPGREHVVRVAGFYQLVGYLVCLGVLKERVVRPMIGVRAKQAWEVLAESIKSERVIYPGAVGYRFFEDLAARTQDVTFQTIVKKYRLRSFT